LEGCHFLTRRALEIHAEPHRPDKNPDDPGCHILGDLRPLVAGEFSDLGVIGLDFSDDRRAIDISVLRLNDRDRLRRSSRAPAEDGEHQSGRNGFAHHSLPVFCRALQTWPALDRYASFRGIASQQLGKACLER
jgi:hypothetical protein